jgi:hypothetical protein
MQVVSIEPVYYCLDNGTGVALIRAEDRPPRGGLIDFMRGPELVKPGAIVPLHWLQLWDYRRGVGDVPGLFRWQQFQEWMLAWPETEPEFRQQWKREFGMPHDDMSDALIVVWEQRSFSPPAGHPAAGWE